MNRNRLKQKLFGGVAWQGMQVLIQDGLIFLLGIILARLLSPADFGVYAIVFFFITIFEVFSEGGMGVALIQKKHIDHQDCTTVFTFNTVCSLAVVAVIWGLAPRIATFYQMPLAMGMLRMLSLKILLDNFRVVSYTLLRRRMMFRQLSMSRIAAVAIGGASGLMVVLAGGGVWGLVVQQLATAGIYTGCCFLLMPWKIRFGYNRRRFRQLFSVGGGILVTQMLIKAADNLYTLIIGKAYSAAALGFYNRAQALQGIPTSLGQRIVGEAGGTVMYRLQSDDSQLRHITGKLMVVDALIFFPVLVGIAAVSEPFMVTILGKRWLPGAEYLPFLCIFGVFMQMAYFSKMIYKVKARIRMLFWSETATRMVMLVGAAMVCWHGGSIRALLYSGMAAYGTGFLLDCYLCHRVVRFGLVERLRLLWKVLLGNFLMYVIVRFANNLLFLNGPEWLRLLLLIVLGVGAYGLCVHIFRIPDYHVALNMLKNKFNIRSVPVTSEPGN